MHSAAALWRRCPATEYAAGSSASGRRRAGHSPAPPPTPLAAPLAAPQRPSTAGAASALLLRAARPPFGRPSTSSGAAAAALVRQQSPPPSPLRCRHAHPRASRAPPAPSSSGGARRFAPQAAPSWRRWPHGRAAARDSSWSVARVVSWRWIAFALPLLQLRLPRPRHPASPLTTGPRSLTPNEPKHRLTLRPSGTLAGRPPAVCRNAERATTTSQRARGR